MVNLWILLLTMLIWNMEVRPVSGQGTLIQSALNSFCTKFPEEPGCENLGGNTGNSNQPSGGGSFVPPPVNRPPSNPVASCPSGARRCGELRSICVPNNYACSVLNSGGRCRVPRGTEYNIQILVCGDGKPVGVICGESSSVPVLTEILVQCQGKNQVDIEDVDDLSTIMGPGKKGGAGVYRCGTSGSWEPLFNSPFFNDLTRSCNNVGCGRLPRPLSNQPVHRRWAWVRGLYINGRLACTATLVSPSAAVTAAHCVTRSLVSRQVLPNIEDFRLEIPGPNKDFPMSEVTPSEIHVHPRFNPQLGYDHDLAVIFFQPTDEYDIPTVCITDTPHTPALGKLQVVFSLQTDAQALIPLWKISESTWDSTCRGSNNPLLGAECGQELPVRRSQFCASHPDVVLTSGSSGGPYLAEVGEGVEEVWVLMGVLSSNRDRRNCNRKHSVFAQVAEDSTWIKSCVFEKRCN